MLLVLVVASVATFLASWNIRENAWLKSRLQVEEDVLRWWKNLSTNQPPVEFTTLNAKFANPNRIERYNQARLYFSSRVVDADPVDSLRLAQEVAVLQQVRIDDLLTLRVSFFGVVLDLNDLTLASGVSFSAILFWLTYALSTELRNLRFVFAKAVQWNQLQAFYELLMMRQVLSRPPAPDEPPREHLNWRRALITLLPLGVQCWVMYHHAESLSAAMSISAAAATTGYLLARFATFCVVLATIPCIVYSVQIDLEWDFRARTLIRIQAERNRVGEELDLFDTAELPQSGTSRTD